MKKLLTFAALSVCAFAFAQTEVKLVNATDSQNKMVKSLKANLDTVGRNFQANGEFLVKFSVNDNQLYNFEIFPKTDKNFEVELKRAVGRSVKKHEGSDDVAMKVAFSQSVKEVDGRTNLSAGDPFRSVIANSGR